MMHKLTLLMLETEYYPLVVNTMPADALALKSPEHQQVWYWLCRTDNIYYCFRVNFIYLDQAKSKIQFKMWIYLYNLQNNSACYRVNTERTVWSHDVFIRLNDLMMILWHWLTSMNKSFQFLLTPFSYCKKRLFVSFFSKLCKYRWR